MHKHNGTHTHTHMQSAEAKLTWSGQFHHNSNSKEVILLLEFLDDNLALSITQSKPSQLPNLDVPWPFFVMESCMNYVCLVCLSHTIPRLHLLCPNAAGCLIPMSDQFFEPNLPELLIVWTASSRLLTISSLSFPADEPPLLCAAFCMGYFFFVPSLPWATSSVKHLVPDLLLQSCELFLASWLSCLVFLRIFIGKNPSSCHSLKRLFFWQIYEPRLVPTKTQTSCWWPSKPQNVQN